MLTEGLTGCRPFTDPERPFIAQTAFELGRSVLASP